MTALRIALPEDDPPVPAPLAAYLRGWWDGATADAWPATPRGLCPLLEAQWDRGVYHGVLSRILERQARRA